MSYIEISALYEERLREIRTIRSCYILSEDSGGISVWPFQLVHINHIFKQKIVKHNHRKPNLNNKPALTPCFFKVFLSISSFCMMEEMSRRLVLLGFPAKLV